MKSIINGKRYDTEKAVVIGDASSGHGHSDFKWWVATLYKTPRAGQFFLSGEGGPMTLFKRSHPDGGWGYGGGIIPLTDNDALEWAEQELGAETVEEHFADQIEDA